MHRKRSLFYIVRVTEMDKEPDCNSGKAKAQGFKSLHALQLSNFSYLKTFKNFDIIFIESKENKRKGEKSMAGKRVSYISLSGKIYTGVIAFTTKEGNAMIFGDAGSPDKFIVGIKDLTFLN